MRPDVAMLGLDRSQGLAAAAARRLSGPDNACSPSPARCADVAVADALALPLRPGACDAVLCVVGAPVLVAAWPPACTQTSAFLRSQATLAIELSHLSISWSLHLRGYASMCKRVVPACIQPGLKSGAVVIRVCACYVTSQHGNLLGN